MSTLQQYSGSVPDIRTLHTAIGAGSKGDWLFLDSNTGKVTAISEHSCPNIYAEQPLRPSYTCCCELDSTHVFVIYNLYITNDYYMCAQVLTITGNRTVPGPMYVWKDTSTSYWDCCLADTNKVVIAFKDNNDSSKGKAIVAVVSGDHIAFGSMAEFASDGVGRYDQDIDLCKIDDGKVFISYSKTASPYGGWAIAGTISGDALTFGSEVEFNAGAAVSYPRCCPLGTDKAVVTFRNNPSPYDPAAIVATVSGTVITFGTRQLWEEDQDCYYTAPVQLGTDKFFVAWVRHPTYYGAGIVATVSGTVMTFGSRVNWDETGNVNNRNLTAFTIGTEKVAIVSEGPSDSHECTIATISGLVPTYGSNIPYRYGATGSLITYPAWACSYDTDRVFFAFPEYGGATSYRGCTRIGVVSGTDVSLSNYRYTGIATHDFTDASTVEVMHSGILTGISKPGVDKYFLLSKTRDMIIPASSRRTDIDAMYIGYDTIPGTRVVFSRGYVAEESV